MFRWLFQTICQLPRQACCFLIIGYQYGISPWIGTRCRFYPSCSHYALGALKKRSFLIALWIILVRLLKCHPWHPGGNDPVPDRRKKQ